MRFLRHENRAKFRTQIFQLSFLLAIFAAQTSAQAKSKIDILLLTKESMQEHASDEPRRLTNSVLIEVFGKGNTLNVLNLENRADPVKYRPAKYAVGANLIAFSFAPNTPIHVSLSIQLCDKISGKVILTSDRALVINEKEVEAGLKLQKQEFDNSQYGKALVLLSRMAAKTFEEKVQNLNL